MENAACREPYGQPVENTEGTGGELTERTKIRVKLTSATPLLVEEASQTIEDSTTRARVR
jgi:hypothetical protein